MTTTSELINRVRENTSGETGNDPEKGVNLFKKYNIGRVGDNERTPSEKALFHEPVNLFKKYNIQSGRPVPQPLPEPYRVGLEDRPVPKREAIGRGIDIEEPGTPRPHSLPEPISEPTPAPIQKQGLDLDFKFDEDITEQQPSVLSKAGDLASTAWRGLARGMTDIESSAGTGLRMLGGAVGSEKIKGAGEKIEKYYEELGKPYEQKEELQGDVISKPGLMKKPEWWVYNVFNMLPSQAASLIPGVIAGKAINIAGKVYKLTPKLIETMSRLGAAITAGGAGGSLEGTQTYKEVLRLGGTEEEALKAGASMAATSGFLNAISADRILGQKVSGILGRLGHAGITGLTEGLTEAAEEPAEAVIMKDVLGEKIPESYGSMLKESGKSAATVFPIAGITGLISGMPGGADFSVKGERKTTGVRIPEEKLGLILEDQQAKDRDEENRLFAEANRLLEERKRFVRDTEQRAKDVEEYGVDRGLKRQGLPIGEEGEYGRQGLPIGEESEYAQQGLPLDTLEEEVKAKPKEEAKKSEQGTSQVLPEPSTGGAAQTVSKEPWEMTLDEYSPKRGRIVENPNKNKLYEPTFIEVDESGNIFKGDQREKSWKVGEVKQFYRKGILPKNGKSYDYKEQKYLEGVSVYTLPVATSFAGLKTDAWYTGKGEIVGIGSDGEPLIKPIGKWVKFSEINSDAVEDAHKYFIKQALSEGKTISPEVLKDYPDLQQAQAVSRPEAQPATHKYPIGSRIKIGKSPQTYTITKHIEATPVEIENNEIPYDIKNEQTGKVETVLESEIKPVMVKIKKPVKKGEQNVKVVRGGQVQSGVAQREKPEQVPVEGRGEGEVEGSGILQEQEEKVTPAKTKKHQYSVDKIKHANKIIQELVPHELKRESQARRKTIASMFESLRLHAGKLGIDVPKLSTFYNPQQYADIASGIADKIEVAHEEKVILGEQKLLVETDEESGIFLTQIDDKLRLKAIRILDQAIDKLKKQKRAIIDEDSIKEVTKDIKTAEGQSYYDVIKQVEARGLINLKAVIDRANDTGEVDGGQRIAKLIEQIFEDETDEGEVQTTGGYSEEALNKPVNKVEESLISNTYDPSITLAELKRYGKAHNVTIGKSTPNQAFRTLRSLLIDNPRGYDILAKRKPKTDVEYLNKGKTHEKGGESSGGLFTTGGYSEKARGEAETGKAKELGGIIDEDVPDANKPTIPMPADLEVFHTPELVEMVVKLLDKYPELKNRLKHAIGVFYPGKESIAILRSLGSDPKLAALVLSHELGHGGLDYLPERTLKRGNILGRIGSFRNYLKTLLKEYPGSKHDILTQADRDRLRKLALELAKVEISKQKAEKGRQILPESVLAIWNDIQGKEKNPELYEYIIRLSEYEKKQILLEALKGEIKSFELHKEMPIELDMRKSELYKELIRLEIIKRKLYEEEVIRDELKRLTQIWRPFIETPKSMAYRYKSTELYADAISVLLNNPQLLYNTAPTFYKAFFSWIDKKPDFRDIYWSIISEYKKGTIGDHRAELGRAMTDMGEIAFALPFKDWEALGITGALKESKRVVKSFMVDKFSPLYDTIKNPRIKNNVKNKVEAMLYKDAETGGFYLNEQYHNGGLKEMVAAGINEKDMAEYVKARRIIFERKAIFNPGGHNPETAQTILDSLKKKLGDDYYKLLEDSIEKMWVVRQKEVIDVMKKSGKCPPELIEVIENNKHYFTFDRVENVAKRYGRRITPKIFKQKGMVDEVANPYTSTLLKDMAILDFINTDIAKETAVKGLIADGFKDILDPEYTIKHLPDGKIISIPKESEDLRYKLVSWFEEGKVRGKYLPVAIADAFESDSPRMAAIGKLLRKVAQPYREIFTRKRPYFWVANPLKDMATGIQSLPGWKSIIFPYYSLKNIPSAVRGIKGSGYDPKTQRLYKGKSLVLSVNYQGMTAEQTQLERMFIQHGMANPSPRNIVLRSFERFFAALNFIGDVSERMTKLGVADYLDTHYPDMLEEDKMHLVRWVGSPAWLVGGAGKQLTNNLLPFSNAMIQGYRFQSHVAKEHPIQYAIKTASFAILPKVMMYLGLLGFFTNDIKEFYQKVSKYGMLNYIIPPGWFDKDGKAIALYVPMSEPHRFIGGVIMNAMMAYNKNGEFTWENLLSVLDYTADEFPGVLPAIGLMKDLFTIISSRPVYDNFRGRYAIGDRDIREAKDLRTAFAYFKYFWNQQGMGILHRFDTNNIDEVRTQLQTYTGLPIVSDFVGRYMRIENIGETQQYMGAIEDTKTLESRERLDLKEAIGKMYNGVPFDDWNEKQKNAFMSYVSTHSDNDLKEKLSKYRTRAEGLPLERALESAITIRQKMAVMEKHDELKGENATKQVFKTKLR